MDMIGENEETDDESKNRNKRRRLKIKRIKLEKEKHNQNVQHLQWVFQIFFPMVLIMKQMMRIENDCVVDELFHSVFH